MDASSEAQLAATLNTTIGALEIGILFLSM